jgi:Fe-Mn family superoxide dismutase
LTFNLLTGEPYNYWAWEHMHNALAWRPLPVLDTYEHYYHLDYGSAAGKYVEAYMRNANREEIKRRFVGARRRATLI